MFGTAHVEVHRHPVLFKFLCNKRVAVASVDVAQVIPAATCPLRHGVRLADTLTAVLVRDLEPFGGVCERRLSAVTWLVVLEFRQQHRKFGIVHSRDFAVFPVDYRDFISSFGRSPHIRAGRAILQGHPCAPAARPRGSCNGATAPPQGVTIPNAIALTSSIIPARRNRQFFRPTELPTGSAHTLPSWTCQPTC